MTTHDTEALVARLDSLDAIIHELAGEVNPGGPEDRAWAAINDIRAALAQRPAEAVAAERRTGNSKLVYNKATRTIDTVWASAPVGAGVADAMLDRVIVAIGDQLADADVDYPAGREAGHRIEFDDAEMRKAILSALSGGAAPKEAPEGETKPDFWAVQSGDIHIGMWPNKRHAENAVAESFERTMFPLYRAALCAEAPAQGWRELPNDEATHDYVLQYGGRCRDCADNFGVCESRGMPCDPKAARKAARHVIGALNYGHRNGFLPAAPQQEGR